MGATALANDMRLGFLRNVWLRSWGGSRLPVLVSEGGGNAALKRNEKMWTITRDFIEKPGAVGTCSADFEDAKTSSLKHRFRLLDGDGELYYEGRSDDCDSQQAFAPLDDFGVGFAGCTEIRYLEHGRWESV